MCFFHHNTPLYFQTSFLRNCMYFNNPLRNKVNAQNELGISIFMFKYYGNILEGEIIEEIRKESLGKLLSLYIRKQLNRRNLGVGVPVQCRAVVPGELFSQV